MPSRKGKPNPNSGVVWHFYTHDENKDGKIKEPSRCTAPSARPPSTTGCASPPTSAASSTASTPRPASSTGRHDLEADVWGSPLVVDGKVYIGDGDGDVAIFETGQGEEGDRRPQHGRAVYGSPVMANGTMYILSMHKLFAIQEKK